MGKIFLAFFLFFNLPIFAQFNKKLIEQKMALPIKASMAESLVQIGESFLGLPYEGGTLEGPEEKLVCKLDAFDCYTFVENVLAISMTKYAPAPTYNLYLENLQKLRYREGQIDGYPSRIHYFFEWTKLAEQQKILKDMTPVFGQKVNKKINYMSQNRKYYPSFAKDDNVLSEILKMEKNIEKYVFFQILKENFSTYEDVIKTGDIIAFTSNTPGLDVNHEGIAVRKNNRLYLMHASLDQKKVIVSEETLAQYLFKIKKHAGVMVLRVNNI